MIRYDKLMVYLIALALGTMATLTLFQLIPEAIDIYHSHKVVIPCSHANVYQQLEGQPYSLVINRAGGGPSVPGDGLITHKNDSYYEGDLCYLKFAGPKMFIWEMLTVFCCIIIFYNIQVWSGLRYIFNLMLARWHSKPWSASNWSVFITNNDAPAFSSF